MKKKSCFFLCFELTGGLWLGEDLYSTVSQSDQTPRRVTRDRGEERWRRWLERAVSRSSWWVHLWWHHHDGVWSICLIAREQHWCLEPDLYYAAERQKRENKLSLGGRRQGQPCREKQPQHRATKPKTKWWDVLWKSMKMPWTVSWWKKEWNRGGSGGDAGVMRC